MGVLNSDTVLMIKFLLCFSVTISINAFKEIKAYRLIQYESNDKLFGSQYATLNYIGSYHKSDNIRKIALIKLGEISSIKEIENVLKSNANAILIILNNQGNNELLSDLQIYLSEQTVFMPVYFTNDSEEVNEIYKQLEEEYTATDSISVGITGYLGLNQNLLHFALSSSDPKKFDQLHLENLAGLLEGGSSVHSNPVIAIVTHYDSFSIVPDLPNGINNNGSGVIALLELVRILAKFYENYEDVIKHDILFVLTSAGTLNFEGTQNYINSLDSNLLNNLHFVLCLDSLATLNSDDLFLHLSRHPKPEIEDNAHKLYKIFNTTADNMNFQLNYRKKKVYLTTKTVPWQHEQFSKKKILAATLASTEFPCNNNFNRTTILDNQLDITKLKRNIKFLAESLLAFLFDYDIKNFTIFKHDDTLLDDQNLSSLLHYFQKVSRFPLNVQKGSQINNYLFNTLQLYLQKAQRHVFEYADLKFFDSNSGSIKIYSVKSKMIDLYLLILIAFYLLLLYIYSKGGRNFLDSIKAAFEVDSE